MLKTIQLAFSRPFLLAHAKSHIASSSRFVHNTELKLNKPSGDRVHGENFKWTPKEDAKLLELADKHPSKWKLISEKLGTDKNLQACYNRWHWHQMDKGKPWTKEKDERLAEIVDEFLKHAERFTRNKIDWKAVDPETMLKSYDGDRRAVRLSGPDGYYDPNGVPMVVRVKKKSEVTLYYLAHGKAYRNGQDEHIKSYLKY
ncbi:hypothetical protein FB645_003099 [Coemansia sp. IMI 203386]|nr:hypothetical protein FB645_003099 [Coemansia sp. IMI 203386]